MFRRSALFLLPLCFLQLYAAGQEGDVRFKRITINDGLSVSSVYTIYQDSKGFVWFGTEDGLNRYDGQQVTVYGAAAEPSQVLANKWIELIYEDRTGMIWLGSRGGLTKYDPRKGIFVILSHDPDDPATLSSDSVTVIGTDQRNDVWIGTSRGLNRVDRQTNEVERIIPDEPDLAGLTSRITGFLQDPSGIFWISTERGLYSYDPKSGLFFRETADGLIGFETLVCHMSLAEDVLWAGTSDGLLKLDLTGGRNHRLMPLQEEYESQRIRRVFPDQFEQVWIQTTGGLFWYNTEDQRFDRLLTGGEESHSLSMDPVEPVIIDREGMLWYGTFGKGIYRIDPATRTYRHYVHHAADPSSLSDNSINCLFQDRSGAMWIGTFGAGISILDPKANQFTLFKSDPFDPNSMASSFVWTICETADSTLWIGTDTRGISIYDQRSRQFRHLDHNPDDPGSLSRSSVREIYQDSRGRIWVGTDGGGLDLYQEETGEFRHFRHDPDNPRSISHNSVRAVYEDLDGRIWVGTRNGLNLLEENGTTFRRYLTEQPGKGVPPAGFIYSAILQDQDGMLWVGTYGGGLCRLDPETGQFIQFHHDPEDPTSISDNIVFSVYKDLMGRFWIGTNNGLNMFYPATGSFRRFGTGEGLANEVIYGILPDDRGNIWLSTNLGISRFGLEDFHVKNFDMNDGLQSNEFNGGAYHRGHHGHLYFGGVYGLNIIDPSSIEPVRDVPEVTLTKLEILGKEVRIAGVELEEEFEEHPGRIIEIDGTFYARENVSYLEEIVLDHRHRFFSVEFSAINNLRPGELRYSYIMENLETGWSNAGTRNYVSYANMGSGQYTLKVVAENTDGFRSDPPMELSILVTPPFWLSWWFIALEILVITAIAVMIYNYLVKSRTNRLLRYQNQQISEANAALRESEKNLMELNATKDKFFSIISHDLKNPFSSLLSISELMVENFDAADRDDHKAGFRKINQSVKHLLDLLENLLTWSRSQRGRIKYDPVRFNLTSLIRENINIHRMLAEKKGIMLLSPLQDEIYAYGDRDMINSVIRNLMTNAVKFTDRDKKVEVTVEPKNGELEVCVTDQGIGIAEEDISRLFRIDEKFKSTGTAGERGTGLGLIICREFIEKHGGEISVRSTPGEGSTFTFTIPAAN